MYLIPIELNQLVSDLLDIKSRIRFISASNLLYNSIYVSDLNISMLPACNKILNQKKFSKVLKLEENYSEDYTTTDDITQATIEKLNLIKLKININKLITSISHMNNLRVLYCVSNQNNIGQHEINNLNLIKLDASFNFKIYDVSHMSSLKKLIAMDNCGID